jgi:diaminopimelate epimerase
VPVRVTKMHGAHNDFVILDRRSSPVEDLAGFARFSCERHGGIGADGLIVLDDSVHADVRMRIFNADGSEAEMCGNGIRCAARWLEEAGAGSDLRFETGAGIVETSVVARGPEYLVRVSMGTPHIAPMPVPSLEDARFVDLGNPHVVLFRKRHDDIDLTMLAARLQTMPGLHDGTNVHVAVVDGKALRVRHWERGVGLTMACGTGAIACATAAIALRMVPSPVNVFVPGGRLLVDWVPGGRAFLTGPAVRVFDADVAVEALAAR